MRGLSQFGRQYPVSSANRDPDPLQCPLQCTVQQSSHSDLCPVSPSMHSAQSSHSHLCSVSPSMHTAQSSHSLQCPRCVHIKPLVQWLSKRHTHTHTHTDTHIHTHTQTHTHTDTHIHRHTHTQTHTYTHTYTYTDTHIHTTHTCWTGLSLLSTVCTVASQACALVVRLN